MIWIQNKIIESYLNKRHIKKLNKFKNSKNILAKN